MWSADAWAYMVLVLALVSQWFIEHPLPSIPILFWLMLLVAVVVFPLCLWFRVDLYLYTRHKL